jgi:SAM-dependent methyltransferase
MTVDTQGFREVQRKVWSSGDWPDLAKVIQPVADGLVEVADIKDGQDVLDIGTGSGNVAIRAAERGAKVTGVDITPELFDAARARAKEAGVEVEWVEGDAADLPAPDHSFDRVLSVFGNMFAPIHQQSADELVRVTRRRGLFAICAWTPESRNGRMFKILGEAMPPPPEGVERPVLWGEEEHVRELFAGKDVELQFETDTAGWDWESAESWFEYSEQNLGPMVMAKAVLEPEGKWDEVHGSLLELSKECETEDGGFHFQSDYLRTIGQIPE